ncbi:hypothetical protein JL720_3025 [Aureococcus anophagefferens]|nr:hypothetical protein JL720_3025 [Aureococcus anophagefferens]
MFFDDSVLSRGTGGNGTIETPGGHKLRVLISANGTREPQHVSPTPWAPAPSYGASSGQASSSHLQYSSSMPELGDTAEPGEAPERASAGAAPGDAAAASRTGRSTGTRWRASRTRRPSRSSARCGCPSARRTNSSRTRSPPVSSRAKRRVLEVSGDYDAATNPYGSRVLKPGFRFADALVGTARGRHAALDELPGAPSFGAVEYYSLRRPEAPSGAGLASASPFFVNGTFDADGRLNVSLYEDAENVSAKFSRNGDSSGPGSIPREQERIMATKYDDGESISVASYAHSSRASSVAPGTPFTIGSALGLVRTELREVLSREKDEGVPQPRSRQRDERGVPDFTKAPSSAVFHSFRLIFGRAIIARNGLDAWMLVGDGARAERSR